MGLGVLSRASGLLKTQVWGNWQCEKEYVSRSRSSQERHEKMQVRGGWARDGTWSAVLIAIVLGG